MKTKYKLLIAIGIIGLVGILTNPDKARHKEVMKVKIMAYLQQTIKAESKSQNSETETTDQTLEMMMGAPIIDAMIDNVLSTDNYVFFSTTKVTWQGESRIVGIGAFGNVFLSSKVNDAFNKLQAQKK